MGVGVLYGFQRPNNYSRSSCFHALSVSFVPVIGGGVCELFSHSSLQLAPATHCRQRWGLEGASPPPPQEHCSASHPRPPQPFRSMTLGHGKELQVESGACELCRGRSPYEGWCRRRGRRASGAGQLCCLVRATLQPDCLLCPPASTARRITLRKPCCCSSSASPW